MIKKILFVMLSAFVLAACTLHRQEAEPLRQSAPLFPDYADVLLPVNISAPTFALNDSANALESVQAVFSSGSETIIVGSDDTDGICISEADWH